MGYVTDSLDVDNFVKLTSKLILSREYYEISEYNYNYARQNFTPKKISEKLMQIMLEIKYE